MEDLTRIELAVLHYLQDCICEDELHVLNSWLHEDADNMQLFLRMKDIYGLRKGGLRPDDREIKQSWQRLASKIKSSGNRKAFSPTKPVENPNWLYKYAAAAAIAVCLTLGVQMLLRNDKPATVYTELDVESGPRMSHLTLPDGSKVTLNASTKFKFPDRFDNSLREVFLDGEAFFNVVHNAQAPFVVHTGRQKISVLGTTFNVMDYSADDYAIVTVTSGSVKVQPEGNGNGEPDAEYVLKPNQQAYFDKPSSEMTIASVKIDPARTWVNKIYHFHDESLLKIVQRLEKIYGVKITIVTDRLKEVRYTGTFPTSQSIDEVLKIISFDKEFSYKTNGEKIVIK